MLKVLRDILRDSCLTHWLIEANLTTYGIAHLFLVFSNMSSTHQITACALLEPLMSVICEDINTADDDSFSYDNLIDVRREKNPGFGDQFRI